MMLSRIQSYGLDFVSYSLLYFAVIIVETTHGAIRNTGGGNHGSSTGTVIRSMFQYVLCIADNSV